MLEKQRKAHPSPPCRRRINAHMDGHNAPDQPPFLKPITGRVAFTSNLDIILHIRIYHFNLAIKNQPDAKMHVEAFAMSDSPFKTLPKLNPACSQTEYLRTGFFWRLVILEKFRMWLSCAHSEWRWLSGFREKKRRWFGDSETTVHYVISFPQCRIEMSLFSVSFFSIFWKRRGTGANGPMARR